MRNRDPHEVAEQEAWEEAVVIGDAEKEPCGFYTYVKSLGKGAKDPALVQVHLLKVERLGRKFPEKSQRSLRWFKPHEAAAAVAEPELKSSSAEYRISSRGKARISNNWARDGTLNRRS